MFSGFLVSHLHLSFLIVLSTVCTFLFLDSFPYASPTGRHGPSNTFSFAVTDFVNSTQLNSTLLAYCFCVSSRSLFQPRLKIIYFCHTRTVGMDWWFRTTPGKGNQPLPGCTDSPTCSTGRACTRSTRPSCMDSKTHDRTGCKTCAGGCPCGSGPGWVCGCSKCPRCCRTLGSGQSRTPRARAGPRSGWPNCHKCLPRGRKNQRRAAGFGGIAGIAERRGFSVLLLFLLLQKCIN